MKLSKEFIAMFREEAKKAQWEINSWNGKSIDDLVIDYLERKELKPDDFTGAVILTVDEAKRVESLMNDLIDLYNKESIKILASGFETIYMVKHRIKQAEKTNE